MRNFLVLMILILAGTNAYARATEYFETMPDIPLMEGLREFPGEGVIFDKPQGRIIEAVAKLETATEEQVNAFYNETLPQLGWDKVKDGTFEREAETLQISYELHDGATYLKLAVAPQD